MSAAEPIENLKGHSTAEARWAGLGPYYAMFPVEFAFKVIAEYSKLGDSILDPFAGRCSSIYAANALGRFGTGIEINPVGWLYGKVKLDPANIEFVEKRLTEVDSIKHHYVDLTYELPEFFHFCYSKRVLTFLLAARENLDWKNNPVDRTLMVFILVYLHGKLGEGLSNQMRQTKAMGMEYSIRWWKKNNLATPPEIDPVSFLLKRIIWRYAKGIPKNIGSEVVFGDCNVILDEWAGLNNGQKKFSLLFTSPPYYSVTNYHADQWMRIWLLGGSPFPVYSEAESKGRFLSKEKYRNLLLNSFSAAAKLMNDECSIYIRTDARSFTLETTKDVLATCFPEHKVTEIPKPFNSKTQTELFGDKSKKPGEIDLILTN